MRGFNVLWSNAVISVAASGCVVRSWCLSHHTDTEAPVPWLFAAGIGAATWLAYTWQRHVKSTRPRGLRNDHLLWLRTHKRTLRWTGAILVPAALIPLTQTVAIAETAVSTILLFIGLITASLLTLLYAGLPGIRGLQVALRRLPRLKLLWIGLTWSMVTAMWPALMDISSTSMEGTTLFLIASERALVIMALTLPFDLRDKNWDPPSMKTVPQQWGVLGTRVAATAMLIAAALASVAASGGNPALGIGPLLMVPAVACAHERRSPWYFVLLDAALIADAALVLAQA